jgi:electron transfer flavoprotein alpha subunit
VSNVLVVLESRGATLTHASLEALTAAHRLGSPITVVVVGADTAALASRAAQHNVARVVRVEHALLVSYSADAWTAALDPLIRAEEPAFVLFPHSYQARDFAPALAVRFHQMLVSDVVAIDAGPVFLRPVYEGRLLAACRIATAAPGFVSVQAGAFAAAEPGSGAAPIEIFTPDLAPSVLRTHSGEPFRAGGSAVDLTSAARIVSVGRGIQSEERLPMVRELAEALGAELAASRPVCDAGWVSADRQVGSSGQTVAPRLYLALGISGATQHLQGMRGSGCIVAINRDPDAPIFEVADYGIVGDLFELVPAITRALRSA